MAFANGECVCSGSKLRDCSFGNYLKSFKLRSWNCSSDFLLKVGLVCQSILYTFVGYCRYKTISRDQSKSVINDMFFAKRVCLGD